MKLVTSNFIKENKSLLKELLNDALKEYEYVSILATDSIAHEYKVSKNTISSSEVNLLTKRGFVMKVYFENKYFEYSFNNITKNSIKDILKKVKDGISMNFGVKENEYSKINEEEISFEKSSEYLYLPQEYTSEKIINNLTAIKDEALMYSDKILDCFAAYIYQKYTKLFISNKKELIQNVMWSNGYISLMSKKGEEVKDTYKGFSILGGAELIESMKNDVKSLCDSAIGLLSSKAIIPGEYECICTPAVTGLIVHEAFGHGVEMDMFVKDRAMAKDYIGQKVASSLITMKDSASSVKDAASYFFDDEGTIPKETTIIKNGILQGGICDLQTSNILKVKPTGNGRRESYERKAYTRMTNTFFEPGSSTVDEMISSIKYGFLLEDPSSGMEDPKNWGIQCMVNIAREIKDGKLTGNIFSPCILSGYVIDLLNSVSMISDKMQLSGTGYCGKGYKEYVKVTDGGPYIKAKIRLG